MGVGSAVFVSYRRDRSRDLSVVRIIQDVIEQVSGLRNSIAHAPTYLTLIHGPNCTGMTAVLGASEWLSRIDQRQAPPTAELRANPPLGQDQYTGRSFGGLRASPVMLAVRSDVLPRVDRTALLLLLDGILTALRLTLILVLAALARHPDGLTFVLIMLAACLRYGRREEPDDHAFLPKADIEHRPGSSPQD